MAVLTGAFVEIAVVENYGEAGEAETVIGQTTEDIETERDVSEIEWQEHNDPSTKRREGFETATTSFSMLVTDDQQNMKDANILNASGRVQRNIQHDAVYIHAYENETQTDPSATYEMLDAQFVIQNVNWPLEEAAVAETEIWVNGGHGFKQSS